MIAALYVESGGCYYGLPDVDPWDIERDARNYAGPYPVVAHPPCQRWTRMARVNYARYGGEHNRPGNDGGCFAAALAAVREWGGVLEHPQTSYAFGQHGIAKPVTRGAWERTACGGWITVVWQSAYGHPADKATILLYYGTDRPADLDWSRPRASHQVGWHGKTPKSRSRPTLSRKEAMATPIRFRDMLISLAIRA